MMIALAVIAAYLFIGLYFIAPMSVRRQVQAHVQDFPSLSGTAEELASARREAAVFAIPLAFVWPFYLLGLLLMAGLGKRALLSDHELKILAKQQAQRIAELERELGITDSLMNNG